VDAKEREERETLDLCAISTRSSVVGGSFKFGQILFSAPNYFLHDHVSRHPGPQRQVSQESSSHCPLLFNIHCLLLTFTQPSKATSPITILDGRMAVRNYATSISNFEF
jgi:hypothetical protein